MQTKVLRTGTNLIPRLNPNSLLTINDDFSNGELPAGSINGTLSSDGINTRHVRDLNTLITLQSKRIELANSAVNLNRFNIAWFSGTNTLTLPAILNVVVYKQDSAYFHFGFTDLSVPAEYWNPNYGIRIDNAELVSKRVASVNTSLSTSITANILYSLVLAIDASSSALYFEKTGSGLYTFKKSFSLSGHGSLIYPSVALTNASANAMYIEKFRMYKGSYESVAQLEALFPL